MHPTLPRASSYRGQTRSGLTTPGLNAPTRSPWGASNGNTTVPIAPPLAVTGGVAERLKMQKSGNGERRDGDRLRNGAGTPTTHPLKHDWIVYYVHRPPGSKVIEYEKEIKRVASFGSIESFWSIYAHILPPSALPPVTDLLLFASSIRRPVWEELPNGGKWVLRLRKGVADRLWEDSVLALIGDQFEEDEGIVGMVLSVRSQEDILSVWSDREGERLNSVREKLFSILSLPPSTVVDYKSNKSLLESATAKAAAAEARAAGGEENESGGGGGGGRHGHGHGDREHGHGGHRGERHHHHGNTRTYVPREDRGERTERGEREPGGGNYAGRYHANGRANAAAAAIGERRTLERS